ncbi:MAG TPA: hypothetical protein VG055_28995 [Planctomycetaceae bacterium]|jgi:hypothetical protein|nr:hypothetical protein [Planctomycetaceae bacterium]
MNAEPLDSNAIESNERERPWVFLPSPEEIDVLKHQIRAENEAKDAPEGPQHFKRYREPRVGRTE